MKLFSLLMRLFLLCPVGWLFSATDTYDHAGQLVAESYSNGSHAFYEYDDIGNPVKRTTIAPKVNPEANLAVTARVPPGICTALDLHLGGRTHSG